MVVSRIAQDVFGEVDARYILGRVLVAALPAGTSPRVRAELLRLAGLRIGRRTLLMSTFRLLGGRHASRNLEIGSDCFINADCLFDATGSIAIGDHVTFGHGVMVTTSHHEFGHPRRRSGELRPLPVQVGHGAWLSSRVTVLPGVRIGEGAVVAAGAVVARDVEPHTLVAGVPAREVRRL